MKTLRLEAIARLIHGPVVFDVGADHGELEAILENREDITKIYAIENKKGPYNRLVKALSEKGIENDIIPLFSDGIKDLPSTVHTVIIAGMGGSLIIDILKKYPNKTKQIDTLIVDAHNAIPKVREEVSKMGFVIADEKMVREDDIFYEIIKFVRADVAFYGENDIEFGPILRNEKSATFKEKYQNRIHEIDKLLENKKLPKERVDKLTEEKERIEHIL